ncbi:unnamed protein product [Linum trigynum]|uniref:Uncharacterized protein n=1 Tax=Linum trigynum TaxID=586398 RepID=A0AAV2G6A7_9ROSI
MPSMCKSLGATIDVAASVAQPSPTEGDASSGKLNLDTSDQDLEKRSASGHIVDWRFRKKKQGARDGLEIERRKNSPESRIPRGETKELGRSTPSRRDKDSPPEERSVEVSPRFCRSNRQLQTWIWNRRRRRRARDQ